MTQAFPLLWPAGRPRTSSPSRSRFDTSQERAQRILVHEVRLMGGSCLVIATNVELRRDGSPYAIRREPSDKGGAVYFDYKKRPMCFACDRWDRIGDNIYAIAKTIEALRGFERWGSGSMVEQAFTGFVALPPPKERVGGARPSTWRLRGRDRYCLPSQSEATSPGCRRRIARKDGRTDRSPP